MSVVRRAAAILVALALANLAAALFLPTALLLDPQGDGIVPALSAISLLIVTTALSDIGDGLADLGRAAAMLDIALCLAPLVVAAAIGEAARSRSALWYMLATGSLAAAAPWIARGLSASERAARASPGELRYALAFFLSGIVGGFAYWLLAGRRSGLPA